MLFVHGFPDTARTWDDFLQPVADLGYHAVAPYTRGYPPSGIPDGDTNPEILGRDVLAWMDALGAETAILVGHDWGASAVYMAASMAPERISKLVPVAIPHPRALKPTLSLAWNARHFATLKFPGAVGRFAKNNYQGVNTLCRRWAPSWQFTEDDLADVKRAYAEEGALNAVLGYYRGFDGKPSPHTKTKLPMPTLAFAGVEDIAPVQYFYDSKRAYTGDYRVVELPCGHFPQREQTETMLKELLEFLGPA